MLQVGTIRQVQRQLNEEGYCISENALRRWVKSGQIPAVYSGVTAYIALDTVINFLTSQNK